MTLVPGPHSSQRVIKAALNCWRWIFNRFVKHKSEHFKLAKKWWQFDMNIIRHPITGIIKDEDDVSSAECNRMNRLQSGMLWPMVCPDRLGPKRSQLECSSSYRSVRSNMKFDENWARWSRVLDVAYDALWPVPDGGTVSWPTGIRRNTTPAQLICLIGPTRIYWFISEARRSVFNFCQTVCSWHVVLSKWHSVATFSLQVEANWTQLRRLSLKLMVRVAACCSWPWARHVRLTKAGFTGFVRKPCHCSSDRVAL